MNNRVRMLICILGLLTVSLWSTSAFAQSAISVSSVPRTTAISTGHTEIAGDIQLVSAAAGAGGAGSATLTLDYTVPITVPAANISICGSAALAGAGGVCTGGNLYLAATTGAAGTFQIGGANQNQLLIVLPTSAPGAAGTITVNNVKVSLAAFTGTTLNASIAVTAGQTFGQYSIASGQNVTTIITTIAPAFTTATATGATATPLAGTGRGTILSTATVTDRFFNADVPENFVDAFKTTLGTAGYLNDPALTVTFNNIPNGVFLNLAGGVTTNSTNANCTADTATPSLLWNTSTGTTTVIPVANLTNAVVSNSTPSTVLSFTGIPFNATQLEAIRIRGCIYTSGLTAPVALGTITATITLSPNGAALSAGTQIPPVAGNFPRYQVSNVTVNVVDIIAAETDMLISFAVRNTSGFDTGLSIANTSTDPFGTTNGVTPNDGTCTLNFYPQGSGSSFTYTTAAGAPGLGLSSAGVLVSGKTWTVGLSELLAGITGAPTSFTGYIFVRCSFTNAHGAGYVTDYKGFTSSTPFLIVPLSRATANENLGH
jgi:hypothetical protein